MEDSMNHPGTFRRPTPLALLSLLAALGACSPSPPSHQAVATPVERGRYLVDVGGCNDCHTPKVMTAEGPAFDTTRLLSGHRADEAIAAVPAGVIAPTEWGAVTNNSLTAWAGPWGVSFTANLTPDATGLGGWDADVFIRTLRTGRHRGVGRPILPPMPWFNYAKMSDDDLRAVFAYLQSIRPVRNLVPAPIAPATNLSQR